MSITTALGSVIINHAVEGVELGSYWVISSSVSEPSQFLGLNDSGNVAGTNYKVSVTAGCTKPSLVVSVQQVCSELRSVMEMARFLWALTCFTCLNTGCEGTLTFVLLCFLGPGRTVFGCNISENIFFNHV